MKTIRNYLLPFLFVFAISALFVSCEEEEDDEPEESGTATLRVTADIYSSAYDCIVNDWNETFMWVKVYLPNGTLIHRRQANIGSYSDATGSYEIDTSFPGMTTSGTYKIEIWDEPDSHMYEDDTQTISSSDLENSRTERSYSAISKSDAGC